MDRKLKARWIAALTSGKYKQGRKALQCNGEYCCLGVLADLAAPENWTTPNEDGKVGFFYSNYTAINVHNKFLNSLGLTDEQIRPLYILNDQVGLSFEQIAKYIEYML